MEADLIVLIGTVVAAVVTGLFTIVARRMAPRVEKNAVVVSSALSMVEAYRIELQRAKDEIQQLRAELEECRNRDQ